MLQVGATGIEPKLPLLMIIIMNFVSKANGYGKDDRVSTGMGRTSRLTPCPLILLSVSNTRSFLRGSAAGEKTCPLTYSQCHS
jgi:hypothetical protein